MRYAVERARAMEFERDLVAAELHAQENARLQRGLLPSPLLETDELEVALFYLAMTLPLTWLVRRLEVAWKPVSKSQRRVKKEPVYAAVK